MVVAAEEDRVCTPDYLQTPPQSHNGHTASPEAPFASAISADSAPGGTGRHADDGELSGGKQLSMSQSIARSCSIVPEIDLSVSMKQRHGWSAPWLPGLWLMPDGSLFGDLTAPSSLLMSLQFFFETGVPPPPPALHLAIIAGDHLVSII
jgi:hypothetical protein